jgi:hypothetical protein
MRYERKGTWNLVWLVHCIISFVYCWDTVSRIQHVEVTPKHYFTLRGSMLFKFRGLHILCGTRGERSWPWPYKAGLRRFLP